MPTITVNIAGLGHSTNGRANSSKAGHMWITLPGGTTTGYAPGGVTNQDGSTYDPGYFSHSIELTQDQWNAMQDFLDNPQNYGFGTDDHNAFENSCVDYSWKALEQAGLNPDGFEGDLWPWNNRDDILDRYGEDNGKDRGAGNDTYYGERIEGGAGNDTVYGNGGDDAVNGMDGNDRLYGGDGKD
ncbi:MAG: hypothetical protein LGR52_02080, partial [Candidatus Thiosymbion ectosymbiont of Robbea hypermnestra]|nr:hypothetical protein [Candidatus Thiosymbion ectosymbiont of Robbea hypermnestra]